MPSPSDNQTTDSNQKSSIRFGKPVRVHSESIDPEKVSREFQKRKLKKNPKRPKERSDI